MAYPTLAMRIAVPKAFILVGGFDMILLFGMIPLAQALFSIETVQELQTNHHQPSSTLYDFVWMGQ